MPAKARKRSRHPWLRLLGVLLVGGVAAAGCASHPEPKVGSDVEKPSTVEEAEQTLSQAENDLTAMLLGGATEAHEERPGNEGQPGAEVPAPPREPEPMAESDNERRYQRCTRACKALASMTRAAEGLCELTGDDDERCASARGRLRSAEELVHRTCSQCG